MRAADASLLIIALVIAWSVYRAHKRKDGEFNDFNILDLLMEGGRVGRLACAFMATLVVTSWIMVRLTLDGKMTEGFMIGYAGAWVAPIIAKLFSQQPAASSTLTATTTVTEQKVTK